MNSTCTWLRRHRVAALTAVAAFTTLMVAPDVADAGHRRRARRCCCGTFHQGYHYGQFRRANRRFSSRYGYGTRYGYAYNDASWGHSGYAGSAVESAESALPSRAQAEADLQSENNVAGQPQPNLAAKAEQGNRITVNRPITGDDLPPAPDVDFEAEGNTDADAQIQTRDRQSLRQRIQQLQQENNRLKQQLRDARQQGKATRSATDRLNEQTSSDVEAEAAVEAKEKGAKATSDLKADTEVPVPPKADVKSDTNSDVKTGE